MATNVELIEEVPITREVVLESSWVAVDPPGCLAAKNNKSSRVNTPSYKSTSNNEDPTCKPAISLANKTTT